MNWKHVSVNNIDIVTVTETWALPDMSDTEFNIQGFTLFRKDRALAVVKQQKGGV